MDSSPHRPRPGNKELYESHFEHGALFEFSKIINSSLDAGFIYGHILLTIMGKTLSSKGMVLLHTSGGVYEIDAVKGYPRELVGSKVVIQRLPQTLVHVEEVGEARHPWAEFFLKHGVKILLPMHSAERPIGVLAFGARLSGRKLSPTEETYMRSLANISATAIEKIQRINEVQQVNRKLDGKIQELNTLFELGKEFGAILDREKLLRLLALSLMGQIGVSRYLICLKEGADMSVVASKIAGAVPQRELLGELARVKAPTVVSEMIVKKAYTADPREALLRMGLHVIVPMRLQDENKGLILLGEKLSREPFSQPDLEFVSSLANLAIISIENTRLFQEAIEKQKLEDELNIAREIQKGLLPSVLPSIPHFDIAAANISSKQVGGDYYDVITLDAHRHIIAIGDVSGKGPPAALLMANLQATIRALVPLALSLSELTARVNALMCQNTGGNKFVTFFWGMIAHDRMDLTYVNAGHNYPYLIRKDGSVERLDRGGMILGVMQTGVVYEQAHVPMSIGDVLVLFTDGVSEAMDSDSREYGEVRLQNLILRNRNLSAQQLIDAIHHDIKEFVRGAPQSDDITLMVVKVV
jgi:sigma-B regulation protein RsbU (phosphoserine phosphatase)